MSEPRNLRILVDFRCNNACRFCDQGQVGDKDPATLSAIRARVAEALGRGSRRITFIGGEATLDPDRLVAAVVEARRLGADEVGVHTNGRMLAYRGLARALVAAGVRYFEVSLHGVSPPTHDWITRAPGSFSQTLKGVCRIVREGGRVDLNMVLLRSNYRQVPEMVAMAARLGARGLRLRFLVPEGAADTGALPMLLPRYPVLRPYLDRAAAAAALREVDLRLHDVPLCQAGRLSPCVAGPGDPWIGAGGGVWPRSRSVHAAACDSCGLRLRCIGAPQGYLDYYGEADLVAVVRTGPATAGGGGAGEVSSGGVSSKASEVCA